MILGRPGSGARAFAKLRTGGYYVTIAGGTASKVPAGKHQSSFINSVTNLNNSPLLDTLAAYSSNDQLRMPALDGAFYTINK